MWRMLIFFFFFFFFPHRPSHSVYPSQRIIPKGNVAAVEPYIHTPQKSTSIGKKQQQLQQQQHQSQQHSQTQQNQLHQQSQQLLQDLTNLKLNLHQSNGNSNINNSNTINVNHVQFAESDELKLARQKMHTKQHLHELDGGDLNDFATKHTDSKYQTLPYSTKIGMNKSSNNSGMIPVLSYNSNLLKKNDSNDSDSAKVELEIETSGKVQKQQTTVHSIPLNMLNKSVAVPMQNSTIGTSTSTGFTSTMTSMVQSNGKISSKNKSTTKHHIPSGNLVVPPRKPISSVAPTNITLGPKNSIAQNPKVHIVAPSINNAPILSTTTENDKLRPALPPKPNKSSDSDSSPTSTVSSLSLNHNNTVNKTRNGNNFHANANVPTILSVIDKSLPNESNQQKDQQQQIQSNSITHQQNVDNLPIKAKPLTIKKQPLSEQPRLRSMTSGIKPIQYSSRRIEMPPAFLFPEIEKSNLKSDNSRILSTSSTASSILLPTLSTVLTTSTTTTTATSADIKNQSPGSSCTDETDKSTNSSVSCDDKILTPNSEIIRRPRSSLSDHNKVKLSRRVSFDPLALLLDASLEGELELVQKTAMQVMINNSIQIN